MCVYKHTHTHIYITHTYKFRINLNICYASIITSKLHSNIHSLSTNTVIKGLKLHAGRSLARLLYQFINIADSFPIENVHFDGISISRIRQVVPI